MSHGGFYIFRRKWQRCDKNVAISIHKATKEVGTFIENFFYG